MSNTIERTRKRILKDVGNMNETAKLIFDYEDLKEFNDRVKEIQKIKKRKRNLA